MPDVGYWAGNEPDILAPWLFVFGGCPHHTQYWTRWLVEHKYSSKPDGIPGNDDYGTMSAWLVFATLGLYPLSGAPFYIIGSPSLKVRCGSVAAVDHWPVCSYFVLSHTPWPHFVLMFCLVSLFVQRVQISLDVLSGGSVVPNAHSLTVEVSAGWGGVYVQSCAINGISVPAAIVPHDVLQVTFSICHYTRASRCLILEMLQPPAAGPISNASAVYLGVDAHEFANSCVPASINLLRRSCSTFFI
jgi:hypothetical protein